RELDQQPGEELASLLADDGIVEGPRPGPAQVADAARPVLPYGRLRPLLVVGAPDRILVGQVGGPEREPDVVDHHERLGAALTVGLRLLDPAGQAEEGLLFPLVVR